jgi:hypothetical protein
MNAPVRVLVILRGHRQRIQMVLVHRMAVSLQNRHGLSPIRGLSRALLCQAAVV